MYVILDSNIYCQDYFGKSASFKFLVHYLNNSGYTLLLPRLVIQEVANVHARKVKEELDVVRKALDALAKMSELPPLAPPTALETEPYDLHKLMSAAVEDVEVVEYDALEHSAIVERALQVQRPFRPNEKGYRDTVLWLSFLQFVKSCPNGTEVIFINSNKSDFFSDSKTEVEFHPDLQRDLDGLSHINVRPYLSVSAFVDKEIDKEEHLIEHAKAYPNFENYLEEQALAYFDSADPAYLEELGHVVLPGTDVLNYVTAVSSEFMEGVEDMHVDVTNDLGGDNIYVSCTHDLRIVVFYITIPESTFAASRASIAASGHIYDVEEQGRTVVLKLTARAYLTASFIYNRFSEECSGYSSSILGFR